MARSGTFKSNLGKSGDFTPSFDVTIAGTTRRLWMEAFEINETNTAAPNTLHARMRISGVVPAVGQEIKIFNGGIDVGVPLFAGHLMQVTQIGNRAAERPTFELVANDYRWLLSRYAKVTKTYYSQDVNVILTHILATYTNGGFVVGYCPHSLGQIDRIQFTREDVPTAIERLAEAANGSTVLVDYNKHVSIYQTHKFSANEMTLTSSGTDFWDFLSTTDLSQVRTVVIWEGGGSTTSDSVSAGATTIQVDNTSWYSQSGGTVRIGPNLITYTGISVGNGPGTITGCSGIVDDIAPGEEVNVTVSVTDSAAVTALAATLGGGLSGNATYYASDHRLSLSEITTRAAGDLAFFSAPGRRITYTTRNEYVRVGRTVTVSLTAPTTISASLKVQEQRLTNTKPLISGSGVALAFERHVVAATDRRVLADSLVSAGV